MKIKFIDKNKALVNKVKKAVKYFPIKIEVIEGDIFEHEGVIVSASNSSFSMGGGLDAAIKKHYPNECAQVKKEGQIHDVMFTITVGDDFKATRQLIDNALGFALNEKNHMAPDQTMLISGLGTGIGGLDEDDFVWLFLKNISIAYSYGWGIKYTQENGTDYHTGKVLYKSGKTLEEPTALKNNESCTVGLHLGKDFAGAGNYHKPGKIFFCIYDKEDLCHEHTDKVRVSKINVLVKLPQWLGYGQNGKKIVKKIGKKIDPEKYNLYQATKLPSINEIKETGLAKITAQVRDQVGDQVWAQVGAQVGDQVGAQVRDQVGDQVGAQVGDQVWAQVRDQVGAQVRAQVGDQVGAHSYWSIGLIFDLGITHWFGNLLKLGIMVIFVKGKIKIFGKKGVYLGEYDESELK